MSLMMSRVLGGLESGRVAADLSEALARIERTIGVNTHYSSFDLVGARRWLEEFGACASSSSSLPREISVDGNVILQGKSIPIRTYNPSAVDTLVFAHGGAWCIGSIDTVDVLCRWIALRTGIRVVSLGYSLAPEAPFPQAILECSEFISTVLRDAAKTGARVFVAGDSAGANIGAMSLLRLTSSERSQVTGFISLYGAYARKMNLSSHRLFGDGRFGLSSAQMEWFWEMYAPHSINADPAQLTPLEATLNDFPPTLCVATECDMLLDDTLAFYSRLAAANVEVSLSLWPNLSHGCLHLVDQVESVTRAATVIVTFIERSRQRPTISPAAAMIPPSQSGPGGSAGRRHLLARRPHAGTTDAIARSIMVGEFRPGSQLLNEDDASAAYGVSRSAYREAIRTLSAKGLIVALPKVGTRIAERASWQILDPDVLEWRLAHNPDANFIRDLFELRNTIEPSAAEMAAQRRDDDDISTLAGALAVIARSDPSSSEWLRGVVEFHRAVLTSSKNEAIASLWLSVEATIKWAVGLHARLPGLKLVRDPVADHARVFDKIASRDAAGAQSQMRRMIEAAYLDALANLERLQHEFA